MDADSFRPFVDLCAAVARMPKFLDKTAAIERHLKLYAPSTIKKYLYCQLLLPQTLEACNMSNKILISIFADMYNVPVHAVTDAVDSSGDAARALGAICGKPDSDRSQPISLTEVNSMLMLMAMTPKVSEKAALLARLAPKCTVSDMETIVRLIKRKLNTGANLKQVMDALHPLALITYRKTSNLVSVFRRLIDSTFMLGVDTDTDESRLAADVTVFTPVEPMLAEACKSAMMALKKCRGAMLVETKYDGERVQVHYTKNEAKFYSRSLKPVASHKTFSMYTHLVQAFGANTNNAILDAEIVLVDETTSAALPFTALGVHKRRKYANGVMCLFVFDCLLLDDEPLMHLPLAERRNRLEARLTVVPNRVMMTEARRVSTHDELMCMLKDAFRQRLEGLMIKPVNCVYEPGKRRWFKIKKDYLCGGAMADSVDLVVLGAWLGTGKRNGQLSVFLMGCRDEQSGSWVAVTKAHSGLKDFDFERLQSELAPLLVRADACPAWLLCNKQAVPGFVAADPTRMPVWQIIGAQLTSTDHHAPGGVSVRFPRVARIRDDKDWHTATTLQQIKALYDVSNEESDDCVDDELERSDRAIDLAAGSKRKLSP